MPELLPTAPAMASFSARPTTLYWPGRQQHGRLASGSGEVREAYSSAPPWPCPSSFRPVRPPRLGPSLINRGFCSTRKYAEAEPLYRESLVMYFGVWATLRRASDLTALPSPPGLLQVPHARDVWPSSPSWFDDTTSRSPTMPGLRARRPVSSSAATWSARAAAADSAGRHTARPVDRGPPPRRPDPRSRADPATRQKLLDDLKEPHRKLCSKWRRTPRPLLPTVPRLEKLATATPTDPAKVFPPDAAVVAFPGLHLLRAYPWPKTRRPVIAARPVPSSSSPEKILVELGASADIDKAVALWREAIIGPGKQVPADLPQEVRRLVWDKVRKELPPEVKTVRGCVRTAS